MNNFNARYQYVRPGSSSKTTASLQVKAETEQVAYRLAENQAKAKHPGCTIFILELSKR